MTENLAIIIVCGLGLVIVAFAAVGIAALAFIWVPRLGGLAGSLIGSLLAPVVLVISVFVTLASQNTTPPPGDLLVVLAILCGPCLVIGWPSSYLAVRALHRRVERAGLSAREMFE